MRTILALVAGALALAGGQTAAQEYPSRDISVVVVWAAGGGTDIAARVVSAEMEQFLPVRINVTNRTGGVGGSVGMSYVYSRPADGYTLGAIADANVTAGVQGGWDERIHVWYPFIIGGSPSLISVTADSPHQSLDELIEAAKAEPRGIQAAAAAPGSIHHLNLLAIENATGAEFNLVPYPGSAPSQNAALAGEVDVVVTSLAEQKQLLEVGRLRPLAMLAPEAQQLEGVGTIAPASDMFPELEGKLLTQLLALVVRDDAPDDVKQTLSEAFTAALEREAVRQWAEDNAYALSGVVGKEAQDEFLRRESLYSWTLHELGAASVDPATLGIPEPD